MNPASKVDMSPGKAAVGRTALRERESRAPGRCASEGRRDSQIHGRILSYLQLPGDGGPADENHLQP